jgi:glycosyltransferase involved in cell wall biosynthesis
MTGRVQSGSAFARTARWLRSRRAISWLAALAPFRWRLMLRWRLHAVLGTPMPPLPLPRGRSLQLRAGAAPASPGVNLIGYAHGEFGVAENLRACARSLQQQGYPFVVLGLDVGGVSRQQDHSLDPFLANTLPHSVNVFFINADQMPIARKVLGRPAFAGRCNIGFWAWEMETFPRDWHCAFDLVDEVWTPSAFVQQAISAATRKPVLRIPPAIEPQLQARFDRAHFGLPATPFIFLFSYDFNGFPERKNPQAVVAAFRAAFADGADGVRLLVKSTNGHRFPGKLAELQSSVGGDRRIEVRDGFLTREEMTGLQNSVDCFVSLHRAEGFGLGMAECMYLGKPVIATGYSGNLDFMDDDNSLLVDYAMVPLREGDYPYWRGQRWAEADIAHAARCMRQLFDDRDFARRIGTAAAASIRRTHSRSACTAAVAARLQQIEQQHFDR